MNSFQWTFDGWGTAFLSCLITILIGGVGFMLVRNTKIKQKQKAGNNSKQKQVFSGYDKNTPSGKSKKTNIVIQEQTAGDNAEQIQIGGDKHGF